MLKGLISPIDPPWLTFVKGVVGTNVTIKVLCGMMRDGMMAEAYARYAAVARFMLDTLSIKCLDASFDAYVRDMTNTSWDGPAAGGGRCCLSRGLGVFPIFLSLVKWWLLFLRGIKMDADCVEEKFSTAATSVTGRTRR